MNTSLRFLTLLVVNLLGATIAYSQCSYTLDSIAPINCHGDATGAIFISDSITTTPCTAPSVVINEIMYRPNLNDGFSTNPLLTGEYIELIGPAGTNIGCYVLTDGDWSITIPAGTTIPADGLFTLGHNNSPYATTNGIAYDLDVANCGCFVAPTTGGDGILIFSNGGEYLSMHDNTGAFIDGVIYGSPSTGNTPPNGATVSGGVINTSGLSGCVANVTIPAPASFLTAPGGLAINTALIRSPDGTGTWTTQVNGSVNACNVASSAGPLSYLWSNGATTQDITGLTAGTYTVTITDSAACTIIDSFAISQPAPISINNDTSVLTPCGSINITVAGGTIPYTYLWSNGNTTQDLSMASSGGYCVTVTDANNCFNVFCDSTIDPTITIPVDTFYICQGDTVPLQISTNAATIHWTPNNSLSDSTIANPLAFPSATTTYIVTASNPPNGGNLVVNGGFEAGNTGFSSAYSIGTGGTWGLLSNEGTYVINNNANNTHSNFAACTDHTSGTGNFMVVNGSTIANQDVWCQTVNVLPNTTYQFSTWITSVEPNNPAALQFSINGNPIGNIFNASSTTCQWNQFSATWNSGNNTTATICILNQNIGLGGNDFGLDDISFVGVTCSFTDTVVVIVDTLNVNLGTITPVLCHGDATGSITTQASDTSYSYLWNTGATTANLNNLVAGTYNLTVSSSNFCQDSFSIIITEPDSALTLVLDTITHVNCFGDQTGILEVIPSGGTPGYTYLWSGLANNQTTATATGLSANQYMVTLTDANNCTAITTGVITQAPPLLLQYNTTDISCTGTNDGSIEITPSGGTPGYSYQWDAIAGNQTTATATGLGVSTYSVTVTDALGCDTIANGLPILNSIPVDSNNVPLATINGLLDCDLTPTGVLGINTTGTYTYLWSNGATTQNVSGLGLGNYSVTISNTQNCFVVQSGEILAPFIPSVDPFINTFGQVTATENTNTSVIISGGNDQSSLGVLYQWTVIPTTNTIVFDDATQHATNVQGSQSGAYTLLLTATATDSTACVDTGSVVLNIEGKFDGIPNVFTPNGDNANELFRPLGLSENEILRFRIYNRWGQEVYNGDTLENQGWDGKFQGVEQPIEVYIYILEYTLDGGTTIQKQRGEVSLVR